MPYYLYKLTVKERATTKMAVLIDEFEKFKAANVEIKQLRADKPLEEGQSYKIIFADNQAEAEKMATEIREQPIAREWEK